MPTIQELRSQLSGAEHLDDYQLADLYAQASGISPELARYDLGVKQRNTGLMGDMGTALKQGVEKIPGALTGLADIPFALAFDKKPISAAADVAGEFTGFQPGKWSDAAEGEKSKALMLTKAQIDRAWRDGTIAEIAKAYGTAPEAILDTIIQSLPSMVGGGVIGKAARGLMGASKVSPAMAAGIGEGSLTAGMQMDGMDEVDPRRAALAAMASGVTTGAIGGLSAKIGPDIEAAIVGGVPGATARQVAAYNTPWYKAMLTSMGKEGLLEEAPQSGQEAAWQNWAEGKPLGEGVPRQMVEGALAGMGQAAPFALKHHAGLMADRRRLANELREQGFVGDSTTPTDLLGGLDARDRAEYQNELAAFDAPGAQPQIGSEAQWELDQLQAEREAQARRDLRNYNPVDTDFNDLLIDEQMDLDGLRSEVAGQQQWERSRADQADFNDLLASEQADQAHLLQGLTLQQQREFEAYKAQRKLEARRAYEEQLAWEQHQQAVQDQAVADQVAQAEDANDATAAVENQPAIQNSLQAALAQMLGGASSMTDLTLHNNSEQTVPPPDPAASLKRKHDAAQAAKATLSALPQEAQPQEPLQAEGVANGDSSQVVPPGRQEVQGDRQADAGVRQAQGQGTAKPADPAVAKKDLKKPVVPKFAKQQQQVYDHILQAIRNDNADSVIDADGTFKATAIADALGLKNRGNVAAALSGIRKAISKANPGMDLGEFFRSQVKTEHSDVSNHGLSPAAQKSVLDMDDIIGGEDTTPSAGVIKSVGGSQSAVEEDEPMEPENNETEHDRVIAARREEQARVAAEKQVFEALRNTEAGNAAADWDDFKSDTAPAFEDLIDRVKAAWVVAYVDALMEDDHLAAIEKAQREFESELEDSDVKTRETDAGASGRDAGDQERQPEVLQGQGKHHPALVSAAAEAWNSFANERGAVLWGELSESQQFHLLDALESRDSEVMDRAVNAVAKEVGSSRTHDAIQDDASADGNFAGVPKELTEKSQVWAALVDAHNGSGSLAAVVDAIAGQAKNPFVTQIAAKLAGLIASGTPVEVRVESFGSAIPAQFTYYAGDGQPVVRINLDTLSNQQKLSRDVLHEVIHAVTESAIVANPTSLSKAQRVGLEMLRDVYAMVKGHPSLAGEYGVTNIHEFVAEALSNSRFQEKLKALRSDEVAEIPPGLRGKVASLWTKFTTALRGIIGYNNAFSKAVAAFDLLAEAPSVASEANRVRSYNASISGAFNNVKVQPTNLKEAWQKYGPSMMFMDHIARVYDADFVSKGAHLLKDYWNKVTLRSTTARRYVEEAQPIHRAWDKLASDIPAGERALTDALLGATVNQAWGDVEFEHDDNKHLHSDDPTTLAANKQAWEAARDDYRKFRTLAPKFKHLYRDVLGLGTRWLVKEFNLKARVMFQANLPSLMLSLSDDQMRRVTQAFTSEDGKLADKRKLIAGVKEELKKANKSEALNIVRDVEAAVDNQLGKLNEVKGPYFPLMRFGDNVVVFKSDAYEAASKAAEDAREAVKQFRATDPGMVEMEKLLNQAAMERKEFATRPTKARHEAYLATKKQIADLRRQLKGGAKKQLDTLRKDAAAAAKAHKEMIRDAKHFSMEKFESAAKAKMREEELNKRGGGKVYNTVTEEWAKNTDSASSKFISTLESKLLKSLDPDNKARASVAVRSVFVDSINDQSSLKRSLMKRNYVAGYSRDGRRVFSSFVMQGAHRLANIEHFVGLSEGLDAVREHAAEQDKTDSGRRTHIANELTKRFVMDMEYKETKWQNRIASLVNVWNLGLSPAYLTQQALQVTMLTLPYVASRPGIGFKRAGKLMGQAYRDAFDSIDWKNLDTDSFKVDNLKGLSNSEKAMLHELVDAGLIDIFMEHDIGDVAAGDANWRKAANVMKHVNVVARKIELANRLVTALMAYRASGDVQFAKNAVTDTQVNYSNENAPRWMKNNAFAGVKLLMQFKKYQAAMAFMIGRNIWKSFDKTEEGKQARRMMAGILATHFLMAGTLGLPLAGPILALLNLAGAAGADDDEPDFEVLYKNWLADMPGGDVIARGLPAGLFGIDFSRKVGMGSLFNPVPFVKDAQGGKEQAKEYMIAMLGASASQGLKFIDAADKFTDGKFVEGWQASLPKWMADPIKAYRLAEEGITSSKGNTRIGAENFGLKDVAAQALGMPLLETSKYYERNAAFNEAKTAAEGVRNELIGSAAKGDDVSDDIRGFNERHPGRRITQADILKRKQSQKRAERQVTDRGLAVRKADLEYDAKVRF